MPCLEKMKKEYEDQQLNLLMNKRVVDEKCQIIERSPNGSYDNCMCASYPDGCHGTGTVTRPAKVEEIAEFHEYIFKRRDDVRYYLHEGNWVFELQSGAILRMSEKETK